MMFITVTEPNGLFTIAAMSSTSPRTAIPFIPAPVRDGKKGKGEELLLGMVLAIEPMFCRGDGRITLDKDGYTFKTTDGGNSAHFEHTVVVTVDGPIVLTEK